MVSHSVLSLLSFIDFKISKNLIVANKELLLIKRREKDKG